MAQKKIYVGLSRITGGRVVFRSEVEPSESTHGYFYDAVIGPFRTASGATFMARYGAGNPHCQTVLDAERLAHMPSREAT